jgi:hypothetical protein
MIEALNSNSGAVIAIATVGYVLVTLFLLLDARAARRASLAARVEFTAESFPPLYVQLVLRNTGPGLARQVTATRWLQRPDRARVAEHRHAQPSLSAGQHKTFFVDEESGHGGMSSLEALATAGYTLEYEWTWKDDAMLFGQWRRPHSRRETQNLTQLRADFYGGWSLIEADPMESVPKVVDELKATRKALEGILAELRAPVMRSTLQSLHDQPAQTDDPEAQERDIRER